MWGIYGLTYSLHHPSGGGWMDEWIWNEWVDGCANGWVKRYKDEQLDVREDGSSGWMGGWVLWVDGWIDRWMSCRHMSGCMDVIDRWMERLINVNQCKCVCL